MIQTLMMSLIRENLTSHDKEKYYTNDWGAELNVFRM
jgi:hypothetical protein